MNHLGEPLDTATTESAATKFDRTKRPAHQKQRQSAFGPGRDAGHTVETELLDLTGIIDRDELGDQAVKSPVRRHPINVIEIRTRG